MRTTFFPGGSLTHHSPSGEGKPDNSHWASFWGQPGQFANAIGSVGAAMGGSPSWMGTGFAGVGQGMGNALAGMAQGMGTHSGAMSRLGDSMANAYSAYAGANAGLANAMANERRSAYDAMSQGHGNTAQAFARMGDSFANNYGNFAASNAALANSMANERAAAFGAMSQGEAARQLAAGNIANQALSSFGGMGNAAMNAWAQNQSAYNQALSGMFSANQMATSQLGQSRNQALSQLAAPVSQLGRGLAAANAIGSMGDGGGGFSATGPRGPVASGSFGGMGGGMGGMGGQEAFGAIGGLASNIMDNTHLGSLESARSDGLNRLDAQHYSSRSMPFDALRESAGALQALAAPGYGALRQGMDQLYGNINANRGDFSPFARAAQQGFASSSQDLRNIAGPNGSLQRNLNQLYDNVNAGRADFTPFRNDLARGLGGAFGNIRGIGSRMSNDFNQGMRRLDSGISSFGDLGRQMAGANRDTLGAMGGAIGAVSDLWGQSMGRTDAFSTPVERARRDRDAQLFRERTRLEDQARRAQASLQSSTSPMTQGQRGWMGRHLAGLQSQIGLYK